MYIAGHPIKISLCEKKLQDDMSEHLACYILDSLNMTKSTFCTLYRFRSDGTLQSPQPT